MATRRTKTLSTNMFELKLFKQSESKKKVQGKGEKTGATETVIPAMLRGYTGLLPTIILTC